MIAPEPQLWSDSTVNNFFTFTTFLQKIYNWLGGKFLQVFYILFTRIWIRVFLQVFDILFTRIWIRVFLQVFDILFTRNWIRVFLQVFDILFTRNWIRGFLHIIYNYFTFSCFTFFLQLRGPGQAKINENKPCDLQLYSFSILLSLILAMFKNQI